MQRYATRMNIGDELIGDEYDLTGDWALLRSLGNKENYILPTIITRVDPTKKFL